MTQGAVWAAAALRIQVTVESRALVRALILTVGHGRKFSRGSFTERHPSNRLNTLQLFGSFLLLTYML